MQHDPVLPFSDLDTAVLPVPSTAAPQVRRPLLQFPNFARQNDFRGARKQAIQSQRRIAIPHDNLFQ